MGYRKELKELMAHVLLIERILCKQFDIDSATVDKYLKIKREEINKKW